MLTHNKQTADITQKKNQQQNECFYVSFFDQSSLQNDVFYMRQVTCLVEGARTVITHHQLSFFFTFTDAALIIVFLILLP